MNSEDVPPLSTDQMQALHEWLDQIAKEEEEENKRRRFVLLLFKRQFWWESFVAS